MNGVERRPKLADGSVSLSDARRAARRALGLIAQGIDPFERVKPVTRPLISDLAARYWKEHASKQKAAKDVRRHLDKYIIPLLGAKTVAEVQLADAQMLFERVAQRAKFQANRTLATLSKMFSLAERWELRPLNSNVCKLIPRFKERARRRYLRADEAPRLAAALDVEAAHHPVAVAALRFLLHSGMRRGELLAAKWSHLDGRVLRLPDSKNGDQRDVYLSDTALSIIAGVSRSGERIFEALSADELRYCWARVCKEAGISDLRVHDLRRSFASVALSAGVGLSQVSQLLGHKSTQTTRAYAYLVSEAAADAVALASDRLSQMLEGKPTIRTGEAQGGTG